MPFSFPVLNDVALSYSRHVHFIFSVKSDVKKCTKNKTGFPTMGFPGDSNNINIIFKMFNFFLGFLFQAGALAIVGYTGNWKVVVVFLTISVGMNGFVYSGFFVNHLDIAPQYAGVLIGLSNTVATLPGIFSPLLTGIIVQNHVS